MMLRWQVNLFKYFMLALFGMSSPVLAINGTEFPFEAYKQKIDMAVERNAVDRPALLITITQVKQLAQSTQLPSVIAQLARLKYANAEVEPVKDKRIELYKACIATADRALAINANEVVALYWKAVAMGKLGEERGILSALRMTRPVEQLFLRVITLDENYDNAGAHKALGRMYYRLPGFPISFGNKVMALFHLARAHTLFPEDIITRAFYAEVLLDMGKVQEARKHAKFILDTPVESENSLRYSRFIEIAREIARKTGA